MYLPAHFREERLDVLREHITRYPFAVLVTNGSSGLIASHIPLLYDPEPAPYGTLRGHLSRANPQWQDYQAETEALAIFQGPHSYVSPNWYPSKQETGRVVPTWNYAVVHAYGHMATYADEERLRAHVTALTAVHENGFATPWKPGDAPANFIEGMLKGIVGVELTIARLEGKWKVNQNRTLEDRAGVAEALEGRSDGESRDMAALIRERMP
jgi:transcriptional regulator